MSSSVIEPARTIERLWLTGRMPGGKRTGLSVLAIRGTRSDG